MSVALLLGACSPTFITVDRLLSDARENRLRAHHTYQGEQVQVSAVLEHVGMQGFTRYQGTGYAQGFVNVSVKRVRGERPRAVLAPADASLGKLLCYFDKSEIEELAELPIGQETTLRGTVSRYRDEPGGLFVQLNDCSVVD